MSWWLDERPAVPDDPCDGCGMAWWATLLALGYLDAGDLLPNGSVLSALLA